jgi:novobiocin biosynthesis protein NovU/D-mycarose 3-C-methyltransferase
MYHLHTHCRACGFAFHGAGGNRNPTEKLVEVLDLGIQPLANDFCKRGEPHAGYAPLKVLFCPQCSLAQLSVVVDPAVLYKNYPYVTSPSEMMRAHFKALISDIEQETTGLTVLEIGSNDGRLLNIMQLDHGYSVTGVDPAANLVAIANSNGVPTRIGLFGSLLALTLCKADVVIARHVFCHVDDWHDFVLGLEAVSHRGTLICIEVPYAGDTLKQCEFDTVYHEHLSYLTIKAVNALLAPTSFRLHKVIRYEIHGGAILLMLRHKDRATPPPGGFTDAITQEDWDRFSERATEQQLALRNQLDTIRILGKRVAALGASAKSTVWINACGFTRKDIAFIADNTPQKQYTFSPGTDIPIVDEGAILRELPDYLVIFCWNFLPEVLEKFKLAREKGVKFIVPVPKMVVC